MVSYRVNVGAAVAVLLAIIGLMATNSIADICATCGGATENWDLTARSFVTGNLEVPTPPGSSSPQLTRAGNVLATQEAALPRSRMQDMLVPISGFSGSYSEPREAGYDVILDVSSEADEYIQGAIHIPFDSFMRDGALKPTSEVAGILGDAGISRTDSVLVYGKCLPCGIAMTAPYVYWILKYMGHDDVKMLDGDIDAWVAAKLPTETEPAVLPKTTYTPKPRPQLLATYDYVKSDKAKIVDARSFQDYESGTIPGSISLPYEKVIVNGEIRNESELKDIFSILDNKMPIVVFTGTEVQAAVEWFAMELAGYNASLYSLRDWLDNQPKLGLMLERVQAEPNPAVQGSPIRISATFRETNASNNTANEPILRIQGCASCGFNSPQMFATINTSSGVAKLGSSGKVASVANALTCSAMISNATGSNIGKVAMKKISGEEYTGIWNANVEPGRYGVTIVAQDKTASKTFYNILEIDIVASKYKKVGN